MHWRRKWQPTPVFLPGESQGWGSLMGCHLWGHTESDMTEAAFHIYVQIYIHIPSIFFIHSCVNGHLGCFYHGIPSSLITSRQIDGKKWKQWQILFSWAPKITVDVDCSHDIKRHFLLGRRAMTNLDGILKSRDITLPTNVYIVKLWFFQ